MTRSQSLSLLYKQLQKMASVREKVESYKITPEWLIGFFEAEGSFITTTNKSPRIEISQHASDYFLLCSIQKFIGAGSVRFDLRKSHCAVYTLSDKRVLSEKLLPLFDAFLLLQNKVQLYENWKSMHFPCKASCLCSFCSAKTDSIGLARKSKGSHSPQWLAGFTDGDGSFHIIIRKQRDYKCGHQVTMVFDLAQKSGPFMEGDLQNINALFLENKGVLSKVKNMYHLKVVSIKTHYKVIIPFFTKHALQSRKSVDFFLYTAACNALLEKWHLTQAGVKELSKCRQIMRQNRVFVSGMIKKHFKKF